VLLSAAVLALNLVVFGAHARLPAFAARGDRRLARSWRALALPSLGLSIAATLAAVRIQPDAALAWGLTGPDSLRLRLLALALLAVAIADLVGLIGGERLGAREWRMLAVFGLIGLVAWTLASELLRIGAGPVPSRAAYWSGALLRVPLGLAAGELVAGRPRFATLVAGPALLGAWWAWPAVLRAALRPDLLTLGAAVVLLAGCRFVPGALARWAGWAGLALAVLLLARSGWASASMGLGEQLPAEMLFLE
jgi:hypothetical protein